MKRRLGTYLSVVLFLTFTAAGQEAAPKRAGVPIYNVTVIERTAKAINYQYRSGPTLVDFRGTVLLPEAKGQATVESKRGRTEIDVSVDNLVAPTRFGAAYLTYTLWAITPEGAPHNIGELIPNGSNKARMHVSTDLQAFGLIVTAEPYSTTRQPSDVVVLENQVRPDTLGRITEIQAKYELMPRGHYTWDVADGRKSDAAGLPKVSMDRYEALLQLYEAQNAVGIARAGNAEQYAPQTFNKARELLAEAQRLQDSKAATRQVVQVAREAAQTAEDSRAIAEKRSLEEKVAAAETEAAKAQRAQTRAEGELQKMRVEADSARAETEAARSARKQAEGEAAEADRRVPEPAATLAPPPPVSDGRPQADSRKTEMRRRLLEQLSAVLVTRDTPRGLVATISDAGFSGPDVRASASSRILRAAAILAPYPELRIAVEGYSDSSATESQSWKRAESVRKIFIGQGLPAGRITGRGLGDERPLVSNSTDAGREQNRRVEIVISGDPIGTLAVWDRAYSLTPRR